MSEENLELVRRVFDAFGRGDSSAVLTYLSPEVVVRQTPPIPDARTYRGHEGFLQVISDWTEVFDELEMTVEELVDAPGDRVVGRVHQQAHGAGSAAPVEFDTWFVFTVRLGTVVRLEMFSYEKEALEAAGLSEHGGTTAWGEEL